MRTDFPFPLLLRVALVLIMGLSAVGASAQQAASPTAEPTSLSEYRIGAGDVLKISVYQNPDLSLEARVSDTGLLSFPLIGSVRVGGLTTVQAERAIADGLRNGSFVRQPQVNVLVVQVRGNQASVLGQVNRPGRFPLEVAELRLTDLLAMAGGTSPVGSDTVTVVGIRNGQAFRREVDLPALFRSDKRDDDVSIADGDVVYVDRAPMIYIYGEVQRPGTLRLERGMSVLQALAAGGGLTLRGTEKGIQLHRRGPDGKVEIVQPLMDDRLREGDVIFVRESLF